MFKKLLFVTLFTTCLQAFAGGDRVGNGGDVIVCGKKVELLDIYEARLDGLVVKAPAGKEYKEMLQNLIAKKVFPLQERRANLYMSYLKNFEAETAFYPNIELSDVDDAGMVVIPRGCKLKQIAIQLSDSERPPGRKRYTISLDLWNQMDELNKMSLVLHELVYREILQGPVSNSMIVRAMVREIIREGINLEHFLELGWELSKQFEIKKLTLNGLPKKPDFKIYTNEYQEEVIAISSPSISFFGAPYASDYSLDFVSMRLSDQKILKASAEDRIMAQLLRARETYELRKGQFFTASRETSFRDFKFTSDQYYDLDVRFELENKINLPFRNVLSLNYDYGFHGVFSLRYKELNFVSNKINTLHVDPNSGDILKFDFGEGVGVYRDSSGIFVCKSFQLVNELSTPELKVFNNCLADDTKFRTKILTEVLELTLAEDTERFIMSDGELFTQTNEFMLINFPKYISLGKLRNGSGHYAVLPAGPHAYLRNEYNTFQVKHESMKKTYKVNISEGVVDVIFE